jgi:hypothetical protein
MASTPPQQTAPSPTPLAFSIASFVRLIDVSPDTVLREVRDGRLRSIHIRGRRLIPFDEGQAYLRRLSGES